MEINSKADWLSDIKNWFSSEEQVKPIEIGGHVYPASVIVVEDELVLNGAGVRSIENQPVYAVGLYLPTKTSRADTARALLGARKTQLCMLVDLKAADFIASLKHGIGENTNETSQEFIKPELQQLEEVMANLRDLKVGDVIDFDWIPRLGTYISLNRQQIGPIIRGKALYDAVLSIWLGGHSLEEGLKNALLHCGK